MFTSRDHRIRLTSACTLHTEVPGVLMGDQWSAGSLGETDGAVVPGTVTEGLPVNQALSIDAVFRNGVGLLREQPVMALAGGGLLLVMALVIGGLNTGIQLAIAPMVQDAGQYGQILAQFVNIGVSMAQAPIQLLITAGMMVAFGRYVGTDEVRMGDLFSSIVYRPPLGVGHSRVK